MSSPKPTQESMKVTSPQSADEAARSPRIDRFLRLMIDRGASDFFFCVGQPPMMRLDGAVDPIRYRTLHQADFDLYFGEVTPADRWAQFQKTGDADFAYQIDNLARFRINLFRQARGDAAAVRIIPSRHLTFEQLGLPSASERLARVRHGLVLVTGPTGCGKSTTLSTVVNRLNRDSVRHIITIEDPVEFVHQNIRSFINQREIARSATSFASALKGALREDPDVIMVGELRDQETIQTALVAAETGMLVLGTLHTNSASKTVDRIVNLFSHEDRDNIRSQLGGALRGILAQQLVRRKEGGRVAAFELLFGSPALSNLIREGKTSQIDDLIQLGQRDGMVTMDHSLLALVREGTVTPEAAYEKAVDKAAFRHTMAVEFDVQVGLDEDEDLDSLMEESALADPTISQG